MTTDANKRTENTGGSPIGVFDSGVGGLTVVRALMQRLPNENIVYLGDTARVPYGIKSDATIREFAGQIVRFLLEHKPKLLIVACNTMAAVAAREIAALATVPVLDVIDAGARAAVARSQSRRIGVIGTLTTINSGAYEAAIHALDPSAQVRSHACPLFVPLVEEGWLDHPVTRLTAQEYLQPLLAADIDALVLGCTHYPLLEPLLAEVAGARVQLVDSAHTVAEQAAQQLADTGLANGARGPTRYEYYVTDVPQRFQEIGARFLGRALTNTQVVKW